MNDPITIATIAASFLLALGLASLAALKGWNAWLDYKRLELASHTDNLHHGVQSNPQGHSTPAVITRTYDPATHQYETAAQYEARIRTDLGLSVKRIQDNVGVSPKAIVWPYAAYNALSNKIAEDLGMPVSFDLEGRSTPVTRDLHGLARLLVTLNSEPYWLVPL